MLPAPFAQKAVACGDAALSQQEKNEKRRT
jgi:hypothetical protein